MFEFADSVLCLSLLFNLSIEFFNSVIMSFSSRIYVWFLFIVSVLLILSVVHVTVFMVSFSYPCFLVDH